jgi:hypothetical protein
MALNNSHAANKRWGSFSFEIVCGQLKIPHPKKAHVGKRQSHLDD